MLNHVLLVCPSSDIARSGLLVEEFASLPHGHADEGVLAVSLVGVPALAATEHLQRLHSCCRSHGAGACFTTTSATEELLVGLDGVLLVNLLVSNVLLVLAESA